MQECFRGSQPPGYWHSAVPSWEKRFCTSVCLVPWGRICAAKASMSAHKNIVDWDDSAALEAFQDAKSRYWAKINGLPCDIPMPDPDIYIDEVDDKAIIDPKLVEDLEKGPPPPSDVSIDTSVNWDSFVYANSPVPATGWGDAEDENTGGHNANQSVNWDTFFDRKTSSIQPTGWGDAEDHLPTNADPGNGWNQNGGWGDGAIQDCSWGGARNYSSWNNGRDTFLRHSDNWNEEQGRRNYRKGNAGRYGSRFSKSRHQMNNYQANSNNWKDYRERNIADYPYEKTMHAGKPMAVRQWKSKHSYGPINH